MWCTSCALAVEGTVARHAGVESVSVHYPSATLWIAGEPRAIALETLAPRIKRLGYRLTALEPTSDTHARLEQESRYLSLRLAVGALFGMWTMLASIVIYAGALPDPTLERVLAWISGAFSLPVITFAGWPFYLAGWRTLRARRPGMDVLVSLGVLAAVGVSLGLLLRGSAEVYFDTAVMLIVLLLGGRLVETLCRHRGLKALDVLPSAAEEASVWRGEAWQTCALADIRPGERIRLTAGEPIPLDGVLETSAWVDTASLTGESLPRYVAASEEVYAGCRLSRAESTLVVTQAVGSRRLDQLREQMRHYQAQKGELQKLADRFAAWLSPAALAVGLATFPVALLLGLGVEEALVRALSVLVVACPCAVGLAVPLASLAGSGRLLQQGIALRDPAALERLAQVRTIAFDKTGTLTQGKPRLVRWQAREGGDKIAVKALARIAPCSTHPLAQALARWAEREAPTQAFEPEQIDDVPGQGVKVRLDGETLWLGSRAFLAHANIEVPAEAEQEDHAEASEVLLADAQGFLAGFYLFDTPYADTAQSLGALATAGYWVAMISGDRPGAVFAVADAVGLARSACYAERTPEAKARLLEGLPAPTLFVGDGVNDALSLAAADVGMAPANASPAAREGAAAHLLVPGIARLPQALRDARAARRVMVQNLVLSALYNTLALGLVIVMAIPPLVAVLAMVASSLSVTLNAARLAWREPPEEAVGEHSLSEDGTRVAQR
ncbi:cation-translocating P-type ATPase [Halomonas sp. wenzhen-202101]|uniref:Cation-translocating P-type ATPase n=2 Tax=Halomonas dongshanensis TaxID=2890835 RepID=A0ABT2EEA2_9GAMM|nr:cation-translocating P-type ATPase [Halomonas dongshanensis]MCS2609916.1 cation-translocating P-type ATPase [Halomonas dongshanensis]